MKELNDRLASLLTEAGAAAFGSAPAAPVEKEEWERFESWLEKGFNAGMEYMKNYPEIRRDPRLLLEGAQTVISVAFNYRQPNPYPGIATYAIGQDYHKVLRKRLKRAVNEIREEFGGNWRICIDSAPVLERYWARKCGIGSRSPIHGNIIIPGTGSMVFLAEIISSLEVVLSGTAVTDTGKPFPPETRQPRCPTGALQPGGCIDARKCINYLTIEKKEPLTEEERELAGQAFFGCDICQLGCAENRGPTPQILPEFRPLPGLKEFIDGTNPDFPISISPLARKFKHTR